MARYNVELRRTASTTASVGSVTADATRPLRMKVYYLLFGSEATPADNPFLWRVRRCTAAGTSTAVVPTILDPGDLVTEQDAGENHTVEPTYTSNTELLVVPLHQRATFQWSAAPGREIVTPATASNGIGIETPTSAAVVIAASLQFEV